MRLPGSAIAFLLATGGIAAPIFSASVLASAENGPQEQARSSAVAAALQRQQALLSLRGKGLPKELMREARQRRKSLLALASQAPDKVFPLLLSAEEVSAMPAEVQAELEQPLELEGRLDLSYSDFEDGSHQLNVALVEENGRRTQLHTDSLPAGLANGQRIRAAGAWLAGTEQYSDSLFVPDAEQNVLVLAADSGTDGGSNGGTALSGNYAIGEQKTLVMLVNFSNDTSTPWTVEEARNVVFGETNDFMQENSDGRTWLSGDVTGWYTLPLTNDSCNNGDIITAARQQAEFVGVDLSSYNRFIYAFPYTSSCRFSGVAGVGGETTSMLINGAMRSHTISHELGHNLGLHHSHALECGTDTLGTNCTSDEYGDGVDMMGGMQGHFNAFQKTRLSWLDSDQVAEVTESGTFTLSGYAATTTAGLKALKIPNGSDPVTGQPRFYWVEYRQPVGVDAVFAGNANVSNGVVIHQAVEGDGDSSHLLDMTPASQSSNYADTRDPALESGLQFIDEQGDISISTDWVQNGQAQVTVTRGDYVPVETCEHAAPTLNVTPGQSESVSAGTQVTYKITVTNNDTPACDLTGFSFAAAVPSGWNYSLSSLGANLLPGESGNAELKVTSAADATNGNYDVQVTASGRYGNDIQTVIYQLGAGSNINNSPVAKDDIASTEQDRTVVIPVLANDSDPDGDTLMVTALSGVNGKAVINANGTVTFTPAVGFSGTETFSYNVSDGKGGNGSASVAVNVAKAAPVNTAPVASNDSASTEQDKAVTISVLANDSDPDGDTLTVTGTSGVNGTAVINQNGSINFIPAAGFSGTETFSYSVSDGKGGSASASVTVQVSKIVSSNAAPVANDDSASTDGGSIIIAVLANDGDPDGDVLRIASVTQGSKGAVRINADGTLTYTPARNFKHSDSFSYTITDGKATARAMVSISSSDTGGGKGNGKGPNK